MRDFFRAGDTRRIVWLAILLVALIAIAVVCGPDLARGFHDGWVQASG